MDRQRKLAVAIDDDSISMAWLNDAGQVGRIECWPIARFSTLTDALLAFERASEVRLLGADCALSVLGATHGDAILLSRGNWAISRAGLRSVLGREAIVINDVAARAWATLGGMGGRLDPLSATVSQPDFSKAGRWTLTKVDAGVGLATIDTDRAGIVRVLECEMGHCGFAPVTAEDRQLHDALADRARGLISWEMALTVPLDDPLWNRPGLPPTRSQRAAMLARLVGRYTGDTVLAHGAWSGAILTGGRIAELASEAVLADFNQGFETKPKFPRLMRSAPRWRLAAKDLTLAGCAAALNRQG